MTRYLVTKLRLKPPSDEPVSQDGEPSLLGGRSAAAAKTASKAEQTKTCFISKDSGFRRCLVPLAAATLAFGSQAFAHHSFAATYLEGQSVTIEGQLVQFLIRSPHSFVQVMVKEPDGSMVRYVVEWGSPSQLGGQGVTRDTLKPGDYVIISGNPGRNPDDHRVRLLQFRRPKDGWSWGLLPNEKVE